MKLDDLTIGQAKELAAMFGNHANKPSFHQRYIGQYVIVRSRNEGVNAGKVIDIDETGVVLEDARRLWRHRPADKSLSWYEGVANSGLGENCKISVASSEKAICEAYSITVCTKKAEESIRGHVSHEQS